MKKIILCAPSRIYEDYPCGRFSYTAMVDYFEKTGIGAIDMSFEKLNYLDDSYHSVLYSVLKKAKEKNIQIPACHLSFYMPSPDNELLMEQYSKTLKCGIDAAAFMGIKLAVVHPIALYSSKVKYGDWVRANMNFLSPIVEYAKGQGVKICIENMPSDAKKEVVGDHLYGSCAINISSLAEKLGVGICFDVGHANISGYKISEQMEILKNKIDILHIHDNDGVKDEHLVPFEGSIDWSDVAEGIKASDFSGVLDVEVTAWALSGKASVRADFGKRILSSAEKLMNMSGLTLN